MIVSTIEGIIYADSYDLWIPRDLPEENILLKDWIENSIFGREVITGNFKSINKYRITIEEID